MYLLYCVLLVIWLPLLWPMFRLKGRARLLLLVVIAAGIAALVYEIRMFLWSVAAIRLDILVISVLLGCLYLSAAVLLFFKHWRTMATLLAIVLVVIGGGMTNEWLQVGRESQRLTEVFHDANRMLFNAKFRSPETYESHFGPFTGASDRHPIGHWKIDGQSRFTRLIINAQDRVWLFYQCQEDAECHFGPEGSGLHEDGDNPQRWAARLKPRAGVPVEVKITQLEFGTLSVEVRGQTVRFAKAPPPVDPAPSPRSLRYLGPFSKVECSGAHSKIRQLWLWEDGGSRYGVGIFATLIAGRQAGFVTPVVMGEGAGENGGWRFAWQQDGRSGTAFITLKGGDAILTLDLDGRDLEDTDRAVLERGAVFYDERIDLAPLTTGPDWRHWFDTVLIGHFVSGYVPAC